MASRLERMQNLNDLRQYVKDTLCFQNELEVTAFSMTERILIRAGRPCGIFFCLHGPRLVKFTAIWETQQNSILFYGPTGERIERVQLVEAPCLETAAA